MIELTNKLTNITYVLVENGSNISINKDFWDYAGILGTAVAPIIAIVFSIWNNFQIKRLRKEDLQRAEELQERSEVKSHFQEINKFIDEQIYFLDKMTEQDFTNTIVKLQGLISKCAMISRDKTRDLIVYYISTYIEVSYFLLSDHQTRLIEDIQASRRIFLNSIREFDMMLINKDLDFVQKRVAQLNKELTILCKF